MVVLKPTWGGGVDGYACNSMLRLLDEALTLLETVEKRLGEFSVGHSVSKGSLYDMYTSITRLYDKLVELRKNIIDLCSSKEETK